MKAKIEESNVRIEFIIFCLQEKSGHGITE